MESNNQIDLLKGREGNFESYSQDEIQHLASYDYGMVSNWL